MGSIILSQITLLNYTNLWIVICDLFSPTYSIFEIQISNNVIRTNDSNFNVEYIQHNAQINISNAREQHFINQSKSNIQNDNRNNLFLYYEIRTKQFYVIFYIAWF